jgi:hypothetical protein
VRAKVPSARVIYLEPDCYRAGAQPGPASARTPDPEPAEIFLFGSFSVAIVGR